MKLNTLKPAKGARRGAKRVGRGPGSGNGKTAGRGHKGQHSRAGGYHKVGFEGGQMPLQRRLPKRGFRSRRGQVTEIRLRDLAKLDAAVVDLEALRQAGLLGPNAKRAKVIAKGGGADAGLGRALTLKGIAASKGARAAIEQAGGAVVGASAATEDN